MGSTHCSQSPVCSKYVKITLVVNKVGFWLLFKTVYLYLFIVIIYFFYFSYYCQKFIDFLSRVYKYKIHNKIAYKTIDYILGLLFVLSYFYLFSSSCFVFF